MKRTKTVQSIIHALEPVAAKHGFELVDVEVGGTTRTPVLRVFIDKTGGVGIDEITAANSWINACIEKLDPFRGSYTLEVSSPGIDRPLRTLEHFERFKGQTVHIVTKPKEQDKHGKQGDQGKGRSKWTGKLVGVDGTTVIIEVEGKSHRIDYADMKKAHVKGTIDFIRKGTNHVV